MENEIRAARLDFRWHTWSVLGFLILAGITMIAISVALPEAAGFWKELLKELGIVLVAVFGVSMLYEILMAEKHFETFFAGLREYVERGESNGAVCAHLGILEIIPTRDVYEQRYPLSQIFAGAGAGSKIRIVGTSLFLLMTRVESIKRALEQGADIELCGLEPGTLVAEFAKWSPALESADVEATMERFKKLCTWLDHAKPSGKIELRHHSVTLFDSFASFQTGKTQLTVWDVSFGADVTSKRILLVDPTKGLGADLQSRYDRIWNNAALRFRYPPPPSR